MSLVTGSKRAPLRERKHDLYETPAVAVLALLREERLPSVIWEPACGPGSIVQVLRDHGRTVIATDLIEYGCPDSAARIDFLMETAAPAGCQCIVTNPPFKNAGAFIAKARELVPRVYMLARLALIESERRRSILDQGDLARVLVFRKRLPMMHRQGWEGRRASSAMAFAWFVWDRSHDGPTEIRRISWDVYDGQRDLAGSIAVGLTAIRERMANGGPSWERKGEP